MIDRCATRPIREKWNRATGVPHAPTADSPTFAWEFGATHAAPAFPRLLLLVILVSVSACDSGEYLPADVPGVESRRLEDGTIEVRTEGLTLRLEPTANVHIDTVTANPWQIRIGDDVMHVSRSAIRIGSTDYGPAPSGSTVRVSQDGVHIDGEHRGELPELADIDESSDSAASPTDSKRRGDAS